jgi:hypothetical protein
MPRPYGSRQPPSLLDRIEARWDEHVRGKYTSNPEVRDTSGNWRLAVSIENVAQSLADSLGWAPPESEWPPRAVVDVLRERREMDGRKAPPASPEIEQWVARYELRQEIRAYWWDALRWSDESSPLETPGRRRKPRPPSALWEYFDRWASCAEMEPLCRSKFVSRKRGCISWSAESRGWEGVLARVWDKLFLVRLCTSPAFSWADKVANTASRVALSEMGVVDEPINGLLVRLPSQPDEVILIEALRARGKKTWMARFDQALEPERKRCEEAVREAQLAAEAAVEAERVKARCQLDVHIANRDSQWQRLEEEEKSSRIEADQKAAVDEDLYREHLLDTYKNQGLDERQSREALARAMAKENGLPAEDAFRRTTRRSARGLGR